MPFVLPQSAILLQTDVSGMQSFDSAQWNWFGLHAITAGKQNKNVNDATSQNRNNEFVYFTRGFIGCEWFRSSHSYKYSLGTKIQNSV